MRTLTKLQAAVFDEVKGFVERGEPVNRGIIAERVGLNCADYAGRVIMRLEKCGLVRREPSSPYRFTITEGEPAMWERSYREWPIHLLRDVQHDIERELERRSPETMVGIATRVAEKHGLTFEEMTSTSRERRYAWPRQEAAWEMVQRGRWSYPQIARTLKWKDHTTAMHAVEAHERRQAEAKMMEAA